MTISTRPALLVALLASSLVPATSTAAAEYRTTVTLNADGTGVVRSDTTELRSRIEQQVRAWDASRKLNEGDDEGDVVPLVAVPPPPVQAPKPYTEEELEGKLRENMTERNEQSAAAGDFKIESVQVTSNSVRTVTTQTYSSLEDMLRQPYLIWGQLGLPFESLRVEKDSDSHLLLTLTPAPVGNRLAKGTREVWKMNGVSAELRFVLPGKVLSSGPARSEGNAAWIAFDSKKDETLDAAVKLLEAPIVITAELAGLKLDAPLDSKTLMRQFRAGRGAPEIPLTDAGPGFAAEALQVTVTTLHQFPEGQKHLKATRGVAGYPSTGVVVQAKFFAPKGRTLLSVAGVRVLDAVDDKGHHFATAPTNAEEVTSFATGGRARANWTRIQLQLPLPAADAQSIEQINAEAIAVTVGSWKTMTLTNLAARGTNAIDLAGVLPGATLVITRFTSRNQHVILQAQLKGPPGIRQLDLQAMTGDGPNANSWLNERSFKTRGAESTRSFTLQAREMDEHGGRLPGAFSLSVRQPEDPKRERVKFNLKGLDLL